MNLYQLTQNYLTVLEMAENGDNVLDDMETIVERAREHATAKVAERG